MEDMEEYMRCLDEIAKTNHIDEEVFEFEEKPKPAALEDPKEDNEEVDHQEIKEDDPSPVEVPAVDEDPVNDSII